MLNHLKQQVTALETEKSTYIYQIGELHKRHKKEIENYERELEDVKQQKLQMEERLSRVEQTEDAIIKL